MFDRSYAITRRAVDDIYNLYNVLCYILSWQIYIYVYLALRLHCLPDCIISQLADSQRCQLRKEAEKLANF